VGQSFPGSRVPAPRDQHHPRGYGYDLLHFIRWWESVHHTDTITESALTESTLLDYIRFQSSQQPPFSGSTINNRVALADRALRAVFPNAPSQVARGFQETYWRRAPMGLGRPLPALSRLRVRTPQRVILPLSVEEVARFWSSFRCQGRLKTRPTWRSKTRPLELIANVFGTGLRRLWSGGLRRP
jgi:hypothetical protein